MKDIIGIDMNGNEIMVSDYLVFDKEDIAYFYKIENGKPKVFADWSVGFLGLIDYEKRHKILIGSKDVPNVVVNQQKEFYRQITGAKINDLEKVSEKMKEYLELIESNGTGFTPLFGDLDDPTDED